MKTNKKDDDIEIHLAAFKFCVEVSRCMLHCSSHSKKTTKTKKRYTIMIHNAPAGMEYTCMKLYKSVFRGSLME